jgi:hypothetical protein
MIGLMSIVSACSRQSPPSEESKPLSLDNSQSQGAASDERPLPAIASTEPKAYEVSAEDLLAARLAPEQASQGWIRLFDGHTLFGWQIAGAANFRVESGSIVADGGDVCLLCTSLPWRDYELSVDFKAQANTNSGVFLRTLLDPVDVETDCYEVNIAPDDNPFPTGGIVKRQQARASESAQTFDVWRTMTMRLEDNRLQISLDGELVCDYTDPVGLPAGRIGLQHNSGRIEFRNVLLRPLKGQPWLDESLSRWTQYPELDAKFTVDADGSLHVQGGSGQLETRDQFGDFVLTAQYKLATPQVNSGIFFRCIPGDKMMGYECQLNDATRDGNPMSPADGGTGAIFRRQDARIVAGHVDQWSSVVLAANGASMAAWVNGIQVTDWTDDRPADPNPRKGRRDEPGTLMIQGHDPTTEAWIKDLQIVSLDD